MIQLNPTVPVVTPKGKGFAHFLIDYGQEHHLLWVVFLDESGECWTFPNPEVRIQPNPTMGTRPLPLRETQDEPRPKRPK